MKLLYGVHHTNVDLQTGQKCGDTCICMQSNSFIFLDLQPPQIMEILNLYGGQKLPFLDLQAGQKYGDA